MTQGVPVVSDNIRCPSCGARNPASADWCGQCLRRFEEPLTEAPPAPAPAHRAARRGSPPVSVGEDGITWRCRLCEHDNPLEASVCLTCGSPFAATVHAPEVEGGARDANTAALLSLFLPGAGHAYLGRWPEAVGRATLSTWVVAVAFVAALAQGVPASLLLASTFGLAALALWLLGAHDAYRTARGEDDLAVLQGRRYMYVTFTLMAVLMLGLVAAVMAAP